MKAQTRDVLVASCLTLVGLAICTFAQADEVVPAYVSPGIGTLFRWLFGY